MAQDKSIVELWRKQGPVLWAESSYGWICEDGQPITLDPWQRAALQGWWDNRETCSTLALSNIKKVGKTLLDAILLAWRWLALPGQHFAIGNDLDQAQARSFAMVSEMCERNPYLSQTVRITKNELTFEPTGSKLTALSVDAAGNAGANHLTASHTEAWGIIYEAGIRAFEELTPPPGKTFGLPALRICDSYAGFEGESVTWATIVDRGLEGERISTDWPIFKNGGLVLFHMTGAAARQRCYRGTQAEAEAYYAEQAATLRPNAFTRMHSNERTAGEGAFVTTEQWEACYSPDLRPLKPGEKVKMVLGLDASTSRDYTALVGTVWNPDTETVDVKHIKVWKPIKILGLRMGKPTVDLAETIDKEVFRLHEAKLIAEVWLDPYQMHSSLIAYQKAGIRCNELAQNAGRVQSDQALYDAINSRSLRHYGDETLNEHVQAAAASETPRGVRIVKIAAGRHIDALVALSMSHYGSLQGGGQEAGFDVVPNPWEGDNPWHRERGDEWISIRGGAGYIWCSWLQPHPAGITAENCRHSGEGCKSCVEERDHAGYYQAQYEAAKAAENFDYSGDQQQRDFTRRHFQRLADEQEVQRQKTLRYLKMAINHNRQKE